MRGVLVSGGSINVVQLKQHIRENDFIVAVDSGLNYLKEIDMLPHILIGDLDSVKEDTLLWSKEKDISILKYPIEKDKTDTEIAIDYLIHKGINEILMFGCTGTRLDHSLSNISLLRNLDKIGIIGRIIDDKNLIMYLPSSTKVEKKDKEFISVIPLSLEGIVLTLRGFYYELDGEHLEYSTSLGISNFVVDDYGEVILEKGEALLILSKD